MACTRREILKLGGLGAAAAFGGRAAAQDSPASPASVLDERYLSQGLDLLCSAHASDAFVTGHAGGALVSAFYFCREEELEAGTVEVIRDALDTYYPPSPGAFAEEEPAPEELEQLLRSLEERLDQLCRDGHDLIFLSLALRAFHDLPRAATPARIRGLRRTLAALEPRITGAGRIAVPESKPAFAEFVLQEFLASTEGVAEQGFAGHLLTNGRALLDLRDLGYEAFAERCLHAFQLFVQRARPQAPPRDRRAARPRKDFPRPQSKEYWVRRVTAGELELGHLFKYPYGFYGLRRECPDRELSEVCLDNSYRLFRSR